METKTSEEQINSNQSEIREKSVFDNITNQKGNDLLIIGIVVLVFAVGMGAYYLGTQKNQPPSSFQQQNPPSNSAETFQQPTSTTQNDSYFSENSDPQPSQNISKTALLSTDGW